MNQVTKSITHLSLDTSNAQPPPRVVIIEQPTSDAIRFRFEGERVGLPILGVNSTAENETFPTIQICNYHGRASIVISCVTEEKPYRPHPHSLIGQKCDKGIYIFVMNQDTMTAEFRDLCIQQKLKRQIKEALEIRESLGVDPFKTGFAHRSGPSNIDLKAIRLCFQVFLESTDPAKPGFTIPLTPVVSDPLYNFSSEKFRNSRPKID